MGGCRNGGQHLVARRLWCTDHQLCCLVWWLNQACSHEIYIPKPLLSLHRKGQLAGCSLGNRLYFLCLQTLQTLIRPSVTWSKNRFSSDQWILYHVLIFQPRRAKHHAKRVSQCQSAKSGRLMTLLDSSPADFRRFLSVFVDRRLLGNKCCLSTGQVANGIRLTKRCNALSSRSDVTRSLASLSHCWFVCVFSPVGWLQYSGYTSDIQ